MRIEDKAKLMKFIKELRHLACNYEWEENMNHLKNMLREKSRCSAKESKLGKEYEFFKGLHKQSDIDNIISLSKIVSRLGIETPKVKLDFNNIEETYDKIWNDINEQIPIDDDELNWATELAQDTIYNIDKFHVRDEVKYEMMKICMKLLNEDYANYLTPLSKEYYIRVPIAIMNGRQRYMAQWVQI